MFANFGAWAGWQIAKRFLSKAWPFLIVVIALAALWFAVVAPRLELEHERQKTLEASLKTATDSVKRLDATIAAQREIDLEHAAAVDAAASAKTNRIEKTTVIRDAMQARAEADGDPEVGAGLDAFIADLRESQ